MVIQETCLCESARIMGQFVWILVNIFTNTEKFQTRNITYYHSIIVIQKNQSSFGKHISFCSYVAQDFENFLQTFQANEPMIHMLHLKICKLLMNLISKVI